jgi:2,3-bisphosphoglycerate-independent phosphoglycerate mutase
MVTHDLIQRGLSFDDAYAAAHALRDRIADRDEITTQELKDLLQAQLLEMLGPEALERLKESEKGESGPVVDYGDSQQPFSKGLLARSIYASGLELDRAYRLVSQLQAELRRDQVSRLTNDEIVRRVGDLLEREESREVATRYRLMRGIRRLPKPVIFYLAGASGAGKSTLALELAPLLRIYRINATDTIRQVMRMVFSPTILPSLHRSSFEPGREEASPEGPGDGGGDDARRRVIRSFEEQALRVMVGVRGVVDRSVAENTSLLVEGVHLVPPHIPFLDLQGSTYQVPMLLATLDEEVHRARFLSRGFGSRRSERYLRGFANIRMIQEHLLQQAELADVPIIDTSDQDTALLRTLKVLSSVLQKQVPPLAGSASELERPLIPGLLVIIDGMPDRPVRALGGRTPLQAARTPTLDRLAREGRCGLADPVAPEVVPDTAAGTLSLFGQSPLAIKRGPVEALGAGIVMEAGDVALRGNFASLDDQGIVIDRRAGRVRDEAAVLAAAIDRLPLPGATAEDVEVLVRPGTEHRLAIVLRGPQLSSAIVGSDPGDGAVPGPPLVPKPEDPRDEGAVRAAQFLALFEQEARRVLTEHPLNEERRQRGQLPANTVLTRGAGRIHRLVPLEKAGLPLRLTCIGGDATILGIASWLGAETVHQPGMTANLDSDLEAKFEAALDALSNRDLVVVHIKGADIAAHDCRPDLKVGVLERVDALLANLLARHEGPLRVAVGADHATLSESGHHSADPVPVLIWGQGIEADGVSRFDEHSVSAGALGRLPLQLLVPRLFGK